MMHQDLEGEFHAVHDCGPAEQNLFWKFAIKLNVPSAYSQSLHCSNLGHDYYVLFYYIRMLITL